MQNNYISVSGINTITTNPEQEITLNVNQKLRQRWFLPRNIHDSLTY